MMELGDRVELISMRDDPDPIAPGEQGTIDWIGSYIQGTRQIGVEWDNGRGLMLLEGKDRFRVLPKVTTDD